MGKHCILPSAAIADALAVLGENKARNDPHGNIRRFDELSLYGLKDVHRAAPKMALGKSPELGKLVCFAVPAR